MAINYQRVNWDTTMYVNPENMNQMDEGIESACNGVDNLNTSVDERIGDMSTLPQPNVDLSSNITAINSKLPQKSEISMTSGQTVKNTTMTGKKIFVGGVCKNGNYGCDFYKNYANGYYYIRATKDGTATSLTEDATFEFYYYDL